MDLEKELMRHEGVKLKPYKDSLGFWTIGVGYCYEKRGMPLALLTEVLSGGFTQETALKLMREEIAQCRTQLSEWLGDTWGRLGSVRQDVLVNMCYNLGIGRLKGFKKFRQALDEGQWQQAAAEMRSSRWAAQVKGRAVELSAMMASGKREVAGA